MGNPAKAIQDFARKHKIDRIVMTTHGRTAINRCVCGSVADKVLRAADRTVVLVRTGSPIGIQSGKINAIEDKTFGNSAPREEEKCAPVPTGHKDLLIRKAWNQLLRFRAGSVSI